MPLWCCRRLYYSDCALSSVNTGSLFTCSLSAAAAAAAAAAADDCQAVSTRATLVCVSSLVVSAQRLYWSDVGLGLIASAPISHSSPATGTVRALR